MLNFRVVGLSSSLTKIVYILHIAGYNNKSDCKHLYMLNFRVVGLSSSLTKIVYILHIAGYNNKYLSDVKNVSLFTSRFSSGF